MDFDFIKLLIANLENIDIFKYTFTGSKVLALGLLAFKILETFVKDFDNKDPKIGNIMSIFGYGLLIMSSDWIITTIEDIFASIDVTMHSTKSDLYLDLQNQISEKLRDMSENDEYWYEKLNTFLSSIEISVFYMLAMILGALFKIADLSITASYLVQRVFVLKFLQFLFPLSVALSTYTGTAKLFHTWILRYIGIFILGIAYVGIINIMPIIQTILLAQFENNVDDTYFYGIGILVTVIVVFTIKVKLFAFVTNYVMGMFQ